jgi:cytolysin (calcineurin-like family phosphatase)
VEFKLKQAIAAAMKENINMTNVVANENLRGLFLIGMVKSANNRWQAPSLEIDGEVTFFCEAGYVAKFYLNYTLDGQQKSFTSGNMSVGYWEKFTIPAAAKNIEVKGVMLLAGEKQIFKETLQRPTYISYKVYGTAFQPAWSIDWPLSVSGEISSTAGELKFNHGAGFVAKWQVTYDLPGKPNQSIDSGNTSLGWKNTYNIPLDATNVRVLVQGATGLVWEPWRTTYDKTFPSAPNLCLKIYGTTLDQKWNNDCA